MSCGDFKYCSYCRDYGHSLEDCWCTRPVSWNGGEPLYIPPMSVIPKPKEEKPFGYWHVGPTEEESDFFLASESGNVACPKCIPLYKKEKDA